MIYLMRHGRTDWNARTKIQGVTDIPLNEEGRQMARDAREKFKDIKFDVCYCSPLSRARETAELFLEGRDIEIIFDDRLREMNFGDYEGTEKAYETPENPINVLFEKPEEYIPDGGVESFDHLYMRTGEFLRKVAIPEAMAGKDVLISGHGALFSAILCQMKNLPLKSFWGQLINNCEVVKLPETWKIEGAYPMLEGKSDENTVGKAEKKPLIGVTPSYDEKNKRTYSCYGNTEAVILAGGVPVVLPATDDEELLSRYANLCDGILFSGGPDFGADVLGEPILNDTVEVEPVRDAMEFPLFRMAKALDKPILGICRGMQLINVALGGSIYQDLPVQFESSISHRANDGENEATHTIQIDNHSALYKIVEKNELEVNSLHHQALKNLAPGVIPMASSEDGIVEAITVQGAKYIRGYQWHPEVMVLNDENMLLIMKDFIEHCK